MKRKQFTFFRSFSDCICRIKNKSARCDAYDAIVRYALDEMEPDLDKLPDTAVMAFVMAKPVLDSCRKKAESGKRGGEAKEEASKPEANDKQTESNDEATRKGERGGERERDRERMLKPPISPAPEKEAKPKQNDAMRGEIVTAFDRFWEAYPRKTGKGAARKAFEKVKVPLEQLLSAVEAQKQSKQWNIEGGRFIPMAATWLNQERWDDTVTESNASYGDSTADRLLRMAMRGEFDE